MVKNSDGKVRKSGSIYSKVLRVLYSTLLCVTMMCAGLPLRASRYAYVSFPRSVLPTIVDRALRVPCPLRGCYQFSLVFENIGHTIFNRNNRFQNQTARCMPEIVTYVLAYILKSPFFSGTSRSILSGIFRRYGCQQRQQIHSLAIYAT